MTTLKHGQHVVRLRDGQRGKVRLLKGGHTWCVEWVSGPGEGEEVRYNDPSDLCREWALNNGREWVIDDGFSWLPQRDWGDKPVTLRYVPSDLRLTPPSAPPPPPPPSTTPPPPSTTPTTRPNYYRVPCLVRLLDDDAQRAQTAALVECQDLIEALDLDFNCGNTLKYLFRCGRKTPDRIDDLRKARIYLDFAIDALTREAK